MGDFGPTFKTALDAFHNHHHQNAQNIFWKNNVHFYSDFFKYQGQRALKLFSHYRCPNIIEDLHITQSLLASYLLRHLLCFSFWYLPIQAVKRDTLENDPFHEFHGHI